MTSGSFSLIRFSFFTFFLFSNNKYFSPLLFMNIPIGISSFTKIFTLYDFEKAYFWANKAIGLNKMIGKAYFQRAEVLVQLVDYYRSDELDFCDRLVFDLAVQDYNSAYKNGVLNAKVYKNNLKELVTNIGDWFLLGDKYAVISPDSPECDKIKEKDCYSFIKNREVLKK